MSIFAMNNLSESDIEAILLKCEPDDALKVFGIEGNKLAGWMNVTQWLYEINLQENLEKRSKSFSRKEIEEAEDRISRALNTFYKVQKAEHIVDIMFFDFNEVLSVVESISEDDFFLCLRIMPNAIKHHLKFSYSETLKMRLKEEVGPCPIVMIEEAQERVLTQMKKIRPN